MILKEIETLKAMYDDELSIDDKSDSAVNITYFIQLFRYFGINIKFCITKDTQTISVVNGANSKKLIPSQTLSQIEEILKDKYDSEREYMPIYQCISFCNDELLDDETLNLSNQLKIFRLTKHKMMKTI